MFFVLLSSTKAVALATPCVGQLVCGHVCSIESETLLVDGNQGAEPDSLFVGGARC